MIYVDSFDSLLEIVQADCVFNEFFTQTSVVVVFFKVVVDYVGIFMMDVFTLSPVLAQSIVNLCAFDL